jgi:outer membrane protein assembly factor BamE
MRVSTSPVLLLLCLGLAASGCVYRMNIQQGNYLEPKTVEQLQLGMTRSQVRYLLGTPMIPEAFDKNRWDYLYYMKQGRLRTPEQQHLAVYFENDKVSRIERDGKAAPPAPVADVADAASSTPPP